MNANAQTASAPRSATPRAPDARTPALVRALRRVDNMVGEAELWTGMLAMAGVVLLLMAQVFYRYLLKAPLFFAEEVALLLMIVATFCGLSLLVKRRRLVSVDLLAPLLPPAAVSGLKRLTDMVVVIVSAIIAWTAFSYVSTPWVWSELSPTLGIPRAYIYVLFGVEMAFVALHQLVAMVTPLERGDAAEGEFGP